MSGKKNNNNNKAITTNKVSKTYHCMDETLAGTSINGNGGQGLNFTRIGLTKIANESVKNDEFRQIASLEIQKQLALTQHYIATSAPDAKRFTFGKPKQISSSSTVIKRE